MRDVPVRVVVLMSVCVIALSGCPKGEDGDDAGIDLPGIEGRSQWDRGVIDADPTPQDGAFPEEVGRPDRVTGDGVQPEPCGPTNCAGCCMADFCYNGMNPQRCGRRGETCRFCEPAAACVAGNCIGADAGVDGRDAGDAGRDVFMGCGPDNCPGCCSMDQICFPGTTPEACGTDGERCSECVPPAICDPSTFRCRS